MALIALGYRVDINGACVHRTGESNGPVGECEEIEGIHVRAYDQTSSEYSQ